MIKKAYLSLGMVALCMGSGLTPAATWPTWGNTLGNTRYQALETSISPATASSLKLKWSISTSGNVTGTPAVDSSYIYFADSSGFLYKANRNTGAIVWKFPISNYTGIIGDFARGTPALVNGVLILGNQSGRMAVPAPAQVFAVNTSTGAKVWSTQVDSTVMSYVTNSPVVYNGTAFVGIASNEELVAGFIPAAAGWTWHFRGSVVALNVNTGAIEWQTFTVPNGYYGGAVWGSTAAVNPILNTIYVGTGNNYWVPTGAQSCLAKGGSPTSCLASNDYFDSILALNMTTGAVEWAGRGMAYDAENVGCGLDIPGIIQVPPNDNCPNPHGPDWDFAQGPMLLSSGGVGAGEKSGVFWNFNPYFFGSRNWSTQVAPGGSSGGMQWGSATDGFNVYVAVGNAGESTGTTPTPPGPWKLKNGGTVYYGGWAALNPITGAVVWTTPDPAQSFAVGPVSVANEVLFGCDLSSNGTMYALSAINGAVLWSYNSGAPCIAGAAIADGVVYWGSGTTSGGPTKVFAFSVNGK